MNDNNTERKPFPASGECECGQSEWLDCEDGYCRASHASFEDGLFFVSMDGWDDMSESGTTNYAMCSACSSEYELPTEVEYL